MIEARLINRRQLDDLLEYQRRQNEKVMLGRLSVEIGLVPEDEFAPFVASYFGFQYLDLKEYYGIEKQALDLVPEAIARRLNALPLVKEGRTLTVAVPDPMDLVALENLEIISRCRVKPVVSSPNQIKHKITMSYGIL